MSQRLPLPLPNLNALRRLWTTEIAARRLFLPNVPALPMRAPVVVVVEIPEAPATLELPGEVVFVMGETRVVPGQQTGLGVQLNLSARVLELARLFMCEDWVAFATLLMTGAENQNPQKTEGAPSSRPSRSQVRAPQSPRSRSQNIRPARSRQIRRTRSNPTVSRPAAEKPPPSRPSSRAPRSAPEPPPSKPDPESKKKALSTRLLVEARRFLKQSENWTHYDTLRAPRDAEGRKIRKAYSALMMRYHPDNFYKRVSEETLFALEEVYQKITTAYEVLIVPEKRAKYDMEIGNFQASDDEERNHKMALWRQDAYQNSHPREALMGEQLWGEAQSAFHKGSRELAISKLKLALRFHPHLFEARKMLAELEG